MVRIVVPLLCLIWFVACQSSSTSTRTSSPVRWNTALNLRDVSEIESRLQQPVTFGSNSPTMSNDYIRMIPGKQTNPPIIIEVRTGNEWLQAIAKGYQPKEGIDFFLSSWFNFANTLDVIRKARASSRSYLQGFSLQQLRLEDLPAEMAPVESRELIEQVQGKRGWPDSTARITRQDRESMTIEGEWGAVTLRWVAFGDLNGDGIEDVLLDSTYSANAGSLGYGGMVRLTRLQKNGELQLLRR